MVKRKQQWRKAYEAAEEERQAVVEAAEVNKSMFFEDRDGDEVKQPKAAKRQKLAAGGGAAAARDGQVAVKGKSAWESTAELGGPAPRPRRKPAADTWTMVSTGADESLAKVDPWTHTQQKQLGTTADAVNELGYLVNTSARPPAPKNLRVIREKKRLKSERRVADRQAPVEPAHAGSSFNPAEEDRSELLQIAGERLAAEEERRRRIDAGLKRGQSNLAEVLASWDKNGPNGTAGAADQPEQREGRPQRAAAKGGKVKAAAAGKQQAPKGTSPTTDGGEEEEEEEEEEEWMRDSQAPKTRRQRKKHLDHRRRLIEAALRRREKKVDIQLGRVDIISKQVGKEERRQETARAEHEAMLEARGELVPQLGTHTYEELFPEVLMDDELENGSLLQIKPTAHALRAQLKRFEKRALIEPITKSTVSAEFAGTGYYKDKKRRRPGNNLRVLNRK